MFNLCKFNYEKLSIYVIQIIRKSLVQLFCLMMGWAGTALKLKPSN